MKKILIILAAVLLTVNVFSQTPDAFKYQTVVRDANGNAMVSANVDFQISILESSTTGNSVYVETFSSATNQFGLVNLEIGNGTLVSGDFTTINWSNNLHFVKIEVDIFDGNGLQEMGASQLLSVPYALNAKSAENVFSGDYGDLSNQPTIPTQTSDLTNNSGFITSPDDADADPNNEIQTISKTGTTVTLSNSGGSFTDAVNDADASITNEIQTISKSGTTVTLSNSGGSFTDAVNDADASSTNELQTISQTGTSLILSNGGGTVTVADNDNDSANELQTISKSGTTVTLSNSGGSFTDAVNDADASTTNEIQDLNLSGNTLTITNNASATNIDLSGYSSLWQETGNDIYYNNGYVGVGVSNPDGKLIVQGDASINPDSAIFEVKNKDGKTVFAVYEEGVRVYVDDSGTKANSSKGGFAVGGFSATKALTNEYMRITPDSVRMYFDEANTGTGHNGGFSVESFAGTTNNGGVMHLSLDNYFIGHSSGENISATGNYNSTFGYESGMGLTYGDNNVFLGYKSGKSTSSGNDNIMIGYEAGFTNTTGQNNVYIGKSSGYLSTSAYSNTFLGEESGYNTTTGSNNFFGGFKSGRYNTTGFDNVYLGNYSGYFNTTGYYNTFLGYLSGVYNTEGSRNVAIGPYAAYRNKTGISNITLGYMAGYNTDSASYNIFMGSYSGYNSKTGEYNIFQGHYSGYSNTTGQNNIFLGFESGRQTSSGSDNIMIGRSAGRSSTTGFNNVFVGTNAGYANSTGDNNVIIGDDAGYNNTTASYNTFMGYNAGNKNTTGASNLFLGYQAGYYNTKGYQNVMLGYRAGYKSIGTGVMWNNTFNVFIGNSAGYNNVDGGAKVIIGHNAGYSDTSSHYMVAIGKSAGKNSTGEDNVFLGGETGYWLSTGIRNTFLGQIAGHDTKGNNNTFIGYAAGYGADGDQNTFVGNSAGHGNFNTTNNNTFVGYLSGASVSTGSYNTLLGHSAGRNIAAGEYNVFLGYNAGYSETGSNKLYISNSTTSTPLIYGEFNNSIVKINGKLGVGVTGSPLYKVHSVDETLTNDNAAVYGIHAVTEGYGVGVKGVGNYRGVIGSVSSSYSGTIHGGNFYAYNTGTGSAYGIYASAYTSTGSAYAGYFQGNVHVNGTLSKSAGTFKIDHPQDPENKYLIHSFVESPDMKNIYDGVVIIDNSGKAIVELPSYFETLNENFRYLLTAIGSSAPNIYISKEITNNKFEIAGGNAGQKISWQVTGIRKDPYAKANPVIVEQEKNANDKGKYLNPELFSQPKSKAIGYSEKE